MILLNISYWKCWASRLYIYRYLFLNYLAHRDVLEGNQSSWKSCIWYKWRNSKCSPLHIKTQIRKIENFFPKPRYNDHHVAIYKKDKKYAALAKDGTIMPHAAKNKTSINFPTNSKKLWSLLALLLLVMDCEDGTSSELRVSLDGLNTL